MSNLFSFYLLSFFEIVDAICAMQASRLDCFPFECNCVLTRSSLIRQFASYVFFAKRGKWLELGFVTQTICRNLVIFPQLYWTIFVSYKHLTFVKSRRQIDYEHTEMLREFSWKMDGDLLYPKNSMDVECNISNFVSLINGIFSGFSVYSLTGGPSIYG